MARFFRWLFLLALVGGGVTAFYLRAQKEKTAAVSRRVPVVRVQRPTVRGLLVRLSFPATLEAIQAAEIRAVEAKGFIRKITVDKGDKVKRGQLLATVDCPELRQRLRQARQSVRASEALRDNAKLNHDRLLAMRKQRFVSQLELDNARATLDTSEARVQNDRARLTEVENLLAYCTIRAPFAGEVAMRYVDPGEQVRPGSRRILSLVRRDAMRIALAVPERDAASIRDGLPAELTVQGLPGETFFGAVTRHSRTVDRSTRSMLVEIEIPNPSGVLKPGMFGRVQLTVTRFPRAMVVPATTLLATEQGTYVYAVRDGKAVRLPVKIGHDMGEEAQILEGISPREQLIIVGRDLVSDGLPVEAVEVSPVAAPAHLMEPPREPEPPK